MYTQDSLLISSRGSRLAANLLDGFLMTITLFIGWLIWSAILWNEGTTPGHKLLKQQIIIEETGMVANWQQMFIREFLLKIVVNGFGLMFTFGLTYLVDALFIFREDNKTVHDLIMGTIVTDM